jgi:hypothetical protein
MSESHKYLLKIHIRNVEPITVSFTKNLNVSCSHSCLIPLLFFMNLSTFCEIIVNPV